MEMKEPIICDDYCGNARKHCMKISRNTQLIEIVPSEGTTKIMALMKSRNVRAH
jgi:hypothetical protein